MTVSLVSMPWPIINSPSLQLGTLQSLLESHGISTQSHSMFVAFAEHVTEASLPDERQLLIADYDRVSNGSATNGVGEWIFAVPPFRSANAERDERYLSWLAAKEDLSQEVIQTFRDMRGLVPSFVDRCTSEILSSRPTVVGFTTTYCQNVASLLVAKALKVLAPNLPIVFGGCNCEGPMGAAMLRMFPYVDVVVRGEAEGVVAPLMESLMEGRAIPDLPGLCYRRGAEVVENPESAAVQVEVGDLPVPNFDEYFERVERSPLDPEIADRIHFPYEAARGCWWGEKSQCTFCGLNGSSTQYRSKPANQVYEDIVALARKHQCLDMAIVDNILDMHYFRTLIPRLTSDSLDLTVFFETKANLNEEHVRSLAAAGVASIQPGIESLSTPVLKIMRKGATALQNIQLLKWCAQYGVHPLWGIIYGFPGERREHYVRMAEIIPSLVHFTAPGLSPLRLDRFSVYHNDPAGNGISINGALPMYGLIYDGSEDDLADLAYFFDFAYTDGTKPADARDLLKGPIDHWVQHAAANTDALTYRRGPGYLRIDDSRTTVDEAQYTLEMLETEIYLCCSSGRTAEHIRQHLKSRGLGDVALPRIRKALDEFVEARLMYEEADRFLALAIPRQRSRGGWSQDAS